MWTSCPVCDTRVSLMGVYATVFNENRFYFCCVECQQKYTKERELENVESSKPHETI